MSDFDMQIILFEIRTYNIHYHHASNVFFSTLICFLIGQQPRCL